MGVVLGEVVRGPRDGRVHLRAAELLLGGLLSQGGLHQRRTREKDLGPAPHGDDVVRQPRHVGAARRGRSVHHRDLRDAGGGQARHVGEDSPAVHEQLALVQQVGPAALHEADHGEPVLQGDLLGAQALLQSHGGDGSALDGAVIGADEAANTLDEADAHDVAAAGHVLAAVVVVHLEPGEGGQLEERAAGVEQPRHALPGHELAALLELGARLLGVLAHAALEVAHLGEQGEHLLALAGVGLAGDRGWR